MNFDPQESLIGYKKWDRVLNGFASEEGGAGRVKTQNFLNGGGQWDGVRVNDMKRAITSRVARREAGQGSPASTPPAYGTRAQETESEGDESPLPKSFRQNKKG